MAYPHLLAAPASSCCFMCRNFNNRNVGFRLVDRQRESFSPKSTGTGSSIFGALKSGDFISCRWRSNATTDTHILEKSHVQTPTVEIPVTCYQAAQLRHAALVVLNMQLVGIADISEKDEIVKSVMQLKSSEIEEGYTLDAVMSRQNILINVRDKLLFEPEFAGNAREKIPPRSSIRIPWSWLPGALSLLQEVGEEKLVLEIGRVALQHPDAKPYIHDLLLSMILAECAIAKSNFEKKKVSFGFEALARAQSLLRSKASLEKLTLLSEIEESLEELAPACTLELLGVHGSPENAERRQGAIAALRELLKQGLHVEASCTVQDWPSFLNQALNRLTATEIIDLLPWDSLSATRKNKKSLESQHQRGVIDINCFYLVLIAHVALGFSRNQRELIKKAAVMCECLIASDGADLKLEEAFCLFLLGECNEAQAAEKLHQRELNSNSFALTSMLRKESEHSGKELKDVSGVQPSLETWLKESVLVVFSDTQDCSPSLAKFFGNERKVSTVKKGRSAHQTVPSFGHRPLSSAMNLEHRDFGESSQCRNFSKHLGSAVKQLAPTDLQSSLIVGKNDGGSNVREPPIQLKRNLSFHHTRVWESWVAHKYFIRGMPLVAVVGCIMYIAFKLSGMKGTQMDRASKWSFGKPDVASTSLNLSIDSSGDCNSKHVYIRGKGIEGRIKELLANIEMKFRNRPLVKRKQSPHIPASLSTSVTAVSRKQMPLEEAEALVRHWQAIKADALGPSHQIDCLSEVLDESMLTQWQALADAALAKSCYWRFVLLKISVLKAKILSDGFGTEMAEIEAFLEEAAELVDETQPRSPNYYSSYTIHYILRRQDGGSWRFCEGKIVDHGESVKAVFQAPSG